MRCATSWAWSGSSPQVRGRLNYCFTPMFVVGLIPAGAGQTLRRCGTSSPPPAHPRRCGADPSGPSCPAVGSGSSPQVRGRLTTSLLGAEKQRLIPAGAGQTTSTSSRKDAKWAHPRRCGADGRQKHTFVYGEGSSPQVRGRPAGRAFAVPGDGLIPAGAGQTGLAVPGRRVTGAHPRRCGADINRPEGLVQVRGSSPQVRGRQPLVGHAAPGPGLIPAGAGQTACDFVTHWRLRAHPRRCGADSAMSRARRPWLGSSPQVRGRRVGRRRPGHARGLIPAGAGQTVTRTTQ